MGKTEAACFHQLDLSGFSPPPPPMNTIRAAAGIIKSEIMMTAGGAELSFLCQKASLFRDLC